MEVSNAVLSWSDVEKSYALDWRGNSVPALQGFSLSVQRGTICALVGANGSGKSTALKIAAGLMRADRGQCVVGGLSPKDAAREGLVACLPEEAPVPDFDTVTEWLQRLAEIGGVRGAAARDRVAHALHEVGLAELAQRPCDKLSKGQRQRVGIAQAILRGAELLLLDEPMTGLDPRAQAEISALLQRQRASGRTIVLSAHFLPQLEKFCERFAVVDRGRVVFEGDAADVVRGGGLERVYLEASE